MKAVMAFWVFDDKEDKIVRFIGAPVVTCIFAIASVLMERRFQDQVSDVTALGNLLLLYLMMAVVVIDVRYDQHRFGGTFTAHGSWLEFLKSSQRGRAFYSDVLYGSQIVRLLYFCLIIVLYLVIRTLLGGVMTRSLLSSFFCGTVAYLAAQLGSIFTRLIYADYVAYLISVFISVIIVVMGYVVGMIATTTAAGSVSFVTGIVSAIALISGVLVGVLLTVVGIKKKEMEYVDR